MKTTIATLAAFGSVASAHFNLNYPVVRGFDEDKLGTFPCGSFDTVSPNRTLWPLTGGEISLTMGHIDARIEVTIAFGNDPGSAFNTIIQKPLAQTGLGAFCLTSISLPSSLNITEGQNATIQVLTNGDPDGGLFNCADITFSSTAPGPAAGTCKNGTGVTATVDASSTQPNITSGGSSPSGTSSSAASSSTKKSAAVQALKAGAGGLVMAGAAALAIVL